MTSEVVASSSPPLAATSGSLMLGGSTTFLLNIARVFARRGWRLPIVVLSDKVEHREDFSRTTAEIRSISRDHRIYEDRLAWGYEQVARFQPRAVLACLSAESFEILRLLPPGVVRLGIIQSDDPGPYQLFPAYASWLDAMIGVSSAICERLRSMAESKHVRIEYIPYGIDFPAQIARTQRPAQEPLRIVYVGRLIELQKRVSRLGELIRLLEQRRCQVRFTIVGGGPDEAAFRASLAGSSSVEFRGTIPNAEVCSLLRGQDIYILLSDFEGLPLSLLEAMAEGVVPVVSDLPGAIREIVTTETGCRVPVGNVGAAAAAIEQLAADRSLLSRYSSAATRLARDSYHAERMVDQFLNLINDLAPKQDKVVWPSRVSVPVPLGLRHPWAYHGLGRGVRRLLKNSFLKLNHG